MVAERVNGSVDRWWKHEHFVMKWWREGGDYGWLGSGGEMVVEGWRKGGGRGYDFLGERVRSPCAHLAPFPFAVSPIYVDLRF